MKYRPYFVTNSSSGDYYLETDDDYSGGVSNYAKPVSYVSSSLILDIWTVINRNGLAFIRYRDYSGEVTFREIRPMGITRSNDKLYLEAYCYLRNEIRNFRVDRIVKLIPSGAS